MIGRRHLGSHSSPPYLRASVFFEAPTPEELVNAPAHPQPPPQAVLVDEASEDLDDTLEFFLEADDPEIASNAIVLVDASTQVSRPPSRPGSARASPRPFVDDPGILRMVLKVAQMCWLPPLSMAGWGSFRPKIEPTS